MAAARLQVTFHKLDVPRPTAWWEAVRPSGGRVRGGWMPIGRGRLPHDLAHLVTEGHLGLADGFWGLLARGATYRRGTDRRPTRPGRQLVREHRAELDRAERTGNRHHAAWLAGEPTPIAPTYERFERRWRSLPPGGSMTIAWPTLEVAGDPGARPAPSSARVARRERAGATRR